MQAQVRDPQIFLGLGMLALGSGLALNTLLGPLFGNVIDYPFTETVVNETLALEAVTLALVAPLAVVAGVLTLRGHPAGPILMLGPAAYAAYMLMQYVVGPQYTTFAPAVMLHVGLFVIGGALLMGAWTSIDADSLAPRSRGWALAVLALAAFVASRWAGALTGFIQGGPVPAAAADVTMYWSIFLLDLGIIVPVSIVTGIGLVQRRRWATKALYGVVGWFALVPPSVAAMAIVKVLHEDPAGDAGDAVVLAVVAVLVGFAAVRFYAPLFRPSGRVASGRVGGALVASDATR